MERDDEPRPDGADDPMFEAKPVEPVRGLGGEAAPLPRRSAPRGGDAEMWPADDDASEEERIARARRDPSSVRAEDTEPYVGLQYVARLFKIVAMVVIVALTAEIVAALVMEGPSALLPLILEILQGAVLAAVLWGASDLTLLLIDVGHDVRAARVLLGRMSARVGGGFDPGAPPVAPDQRRTPRRGSGEEYVG
ncbi:hypothetical protein [Longimicrobium sp.]|uniref:hypothetical protein n=1 Tax=Longimicrobium sp. TaxID=2029185 RepID=UPI002C40423E|nr:hypothetical protein [Longimicrobium sp.]HSU15566.1 hypothetical protein [Longimicrobium sp.]